MLCSSIGDGATTENFFPADLWMLDKAIARHVGFMKDVKGDS